MKILVVGNCQAPGLADCLRLMSPLDEVQSVHIGVQPVPEGRWNVLLVQTKLRDLVRPGAALGGIDAEQTLAWPTFYFPGYHPDLVYASVGDQHVQTPVGVYHSSIVLHAFKEGWDADRTEKLFCESVFRHLGFFDQWDIAKAAMLEDMAACDLELDGAFDRWVAPGCFAHTVNHPKLLVQSTVAGAVLDKLGITPLTRHPEHFMNDALKDSTVWPVYPAIARHLGIEGSYDFKVSRHLCAPDGPIKILGLRAFIDGCLHWYAHHARDDIRCDRLRDRREAYRDVLGATQVRARSGSNPYRSLPDHQFWTRAVAAPDWSAVDPVVETKFKLHRDDRIATAGSCFAQHIARTLARSGLTYHVTEPAPAELPAEAAQAAGYGLFSARYGNVYTARQLAQLMDRAYGRFVPSDGAWLRQDGRSVDPFRPFVERDGFASATAVAIDRDRHLAAVRQLFETADVFVFTIGLTEAWRARSDGAVFPVAPGVVAPVSDGALYEFVNFGVDDTRRDLRDFLTKLRRVNPRVRVILTVSPVPLMATYEPRHVLVSTVYSKSVLRSAVGEIANDHAFVDYFPSYEIITGPHTRGRHFGPDLRDVQPEGVDRVMHLFRRHYFLSADGERSTDPAPAAPMRAALAAEIRRGAKLVCDEEVLDPAMRPPVMDRGVSRTAWAGRERS